MIEQRFERFPGKLIIVRDTPLNRPWEDYTLGDSYLTVSSWYPLYPEPNDPIDLLGNPFSVRQARLELESQLNQTFSTEARYIIQQIRTNLSPVTPNSPTQHRWLAAIIEDIKAHPFTYLDSRN